MKTVIHLNAVIHLKTSRVYSHNDDGTPKVERLTTKLPNGKAFMNFVRHLHLKGLMKSEPSTVLRVLQFVSQGEYKEIDKAPWQNHVDETIATSKSKEKVNYKELSEKQAKEINDLKAVFESRLKSLEDTKDELGKLVKEVTEKAKADKLSEPKVLDAIPEVKIGYREALELKATELKIVFRANIGNKKLLEKIQAIEPDFKIS